VTESENKRSRQLTVTARCAICRVRLSYGSACHKSCGVPPAEALHHYIATQLLRWLMQP
jgi:hypothetical protein